MTAPRSRTGPGRGIALALVVAGGLACGNKNGSPYPMYTPSEDAAAGGTIGSGLVSGSDARLLPTGAAGAGVDAGPPSGAVTIVIQSPAAGAILSVNQPADVAAKVSITGGTDLIDPSTVRATLVQTGGTGALSAAPLVGPSGDDLFLGKLSLAGLATGDYTLTVTAKSSTGADGSASVMIKVDGGPKITVLSPLAGHHYKGSIIVQVVVDPGAYPPATAPTAMIAGMPVTIQPVGDPAAHIYRSVFDLTMPVPLTGDQLFEVSSKDARGVLTDLKLTFNVDVTGPDITMTQPVPGAIVGGVIKLSAVIADGAGLDDSTLQVLIGDETTTAFRLPLTLDPTVGGFSALFDTKNLSQCGLNVGLCIVRPTVSFRAADALGNERVVSYTIAVDNMPPIADLDPPMIRDSKIDGVLRCSWKFDPLDKDVVAGDAPNDTCVVPQLFDLRARVEDDGNFGTGIKAIPISGVDPLATAAFVLDATTVNGVAQPLVVDTDDDGWCDAVNPLLQPTTAPLTGPRQVLKVRLAPVPPDGIADFTPDPSLPIPNVCEPGIASEIPPDLCRPGPQPTVAISYAGGLPAIWSIEPIKPADPRYCFGSQFDTKANNIAAVTGPAGWKCIAVVTADILGNASTSKPLRVYLPDYAYSGQDSEAFGSFCNQPIPANAGPPPDCTGTYDKTTNTVSPKACKSRDYKLPGNETEICYKGDCG